MSCELLRSGEGGGSVHTDLNRKEWLFFLRLLAVMLIECFTLTGCCVLDLQTYLSLSNHNKDMFHFDWMLCARPTNVLKFK